jgi:hypothetical protein
MLLLFRTLLQQVAPPEPPAPPTTAGSAGPIKLRRPPAPQNAPWKWVPFTPVAPKRPRKKRKAELMFLGH